MIKFQTLAIIFVLIVVPITMLLTYYINSQIDTIAIQNSYDTKLLNSTYDAIIALQLNTINNNVTVIRKLIIEISIDWIISLSEVKRYLLISQL